MTVDIKDKLYRDISNYCKANCLVIKEYINELLKKQFMIDKYGERPCIIIPEKPQEKDTTDEKHEIDAVAEAEKCFKEEIHQEMAEKLKESSREHKTVKSSVIEEKYEDETKEEESVVEKKPKKHKLK